jgi:hypothetical protein
MPLITQALPGLDLDRLDLETLGLGYDGVDAPRALGMLSHSVILPDRRQGLLQLTKRRGPPLGHR